jgi:dimethyladenosine transferase 2, mitochondrial
MWNLFNSNLFFRRWVPGCGPRLIVNAKPPKRPQILFPNENTSLLPDYYARSTTLTAQDYVDNIHVFTQFGMLTPTQLFTVFNQFIHWPEYPNCAFNDMLEKYLERIFSNPEDAIENESDDEEEISEVAENEKQKV